MNDTEYADRLLVELDRMLNDPDVTMDPDQVWSMLAEISQCHAAAVIPAE